MQVATGHLWITSYRKGTLSRNLRHSYTFVLKDRNILTATMKGTLRHLFEVNAFSHSSRAINPQLNRISGTRKYSKLTVSTEEP